MRYTSIIILIIFIFIMSNPLIGQADTLSPMGLGISIDPTKLSELVYVNTFNGSIQQVPTVTSAIVFYMPINVTNGFRLEPSVGISLYQQQYYNRFYNLRNWLFRDNNE